LRSCPWDVRWNGWVTDDTGRRPHIEASEVAATLPPAVNGRQRARKSGALSCLMSATAEDTPPLSPAVIAVHLKDVTAPGMILHRLLRVAQPARYKLIARDETDELPDVAAAPSPSMPTAAVADTRARTPAQARGDLFATLGNYLPDLPSYQPDLDVDTTAWRRLRVKDVARQTTPPPAGVSPSLFVAERTAFRRVPAEVSLPPKARFCLTWSEDAPTGASAMPSSWFQPHAIEFRYAPDKPGAMKQHRFQGVVGTGVTAGTGGVLAFAPPADVSLREPNQLDAPNGAKLSIQQATQAQRTQVQASRLSVAWKDTLGQLAAAVTPATTLITQVSPPAASGKQIQVQLPSDPFVKCFVRINDDLLDINGTEVRFPIYDARLRAVTETPLSDANKRYQEGGSTPGDPRPDAPSLPGLQFLDAMLDPNGGLILAVSPTQLQVYKVTNPAASVGGATIGAGNNLLAVLAMRDGVPCILSTCDKNNNSGVFLVTLSDASQLGALPLTGPGPVLALAALTLRYIGKHGTEVRQKESRPIFGFRLGHDERQAVGAPMDFRRGLGNDPGHLNRPFPARRAVLRSRRNSDSARKPV
jgi:hypothetical protein